MDQYEKYFEENSDNEVEVEHEVVVVGVVAPPPVNIPLEVVVPGVVNNPESTSPSPHSLSPVLESPQPQLGHAPNFMGFFTADDITELEKWAVDAQKLRGTPDLRLEEPEISANFKTFLKVIWGHQWELKFIQSAGEVLICKLRAHLAGYNLLTSFNRRQWLRLLPAWIMEGSSWSHLRAPGLPGVVRPPGLLLGRRSFSAGGHFLRFVTIFVVKNLELHKKEEE